MKNDLFNKSVGDLLSQSENVHESLKKELKDGVWVSPETGETEDLNVSHELMDRDLEILGNRLIYNAAQKAYTLEVNDTSIHVIGKSLIVVADESQNVINVYFGYDTEDELKHEPALIFGFDSGWVDSERNIVITNYFGEMEVDGNTVNLDSVMYPIFMSALRLWEDKKWNLSNPTIVFYVYN